MRTTVSIPDDLLQDALQISGAETYRMAIIMGLQELIHQKRLTKLKKLKGNLDIGIDLAKSRKRS